MLELLFLLLPVAVAYGWVMGQQNIRKELKQKQSELNQALTSSVSLFLNNKEEQAFDKLIQYFDDSPSNIDNYLTLAKLFRKKGEIDKAISIHEGLVKTDQITIPSFQMEVIKLELAKDFLVAGMLSRATDILDPLLTSEHANDALLLQLNIYEQTREWQNGIESFHKISKGEANVETLQLVSHFYCELADRTEDIKLKKDHYKKSSELHPSCIRGLVELAKLNTLLGDKKKTKQLIVDILDKEPSFAPALFNIAPECFDGKEEQAAWMYWLIKEKKIASVTAHNLMADYIAKEKSIEDARQYIIEQLQQTPSVRGFAKLIELEQEFFMSDAHFEQLLALITRYIDLKPNYECNNCGFTSNHFSWRCPACNHWQTIKPLTGLDGI